MGPPCATGGAPHDTAAPGAGAARGGGPVVVGAARGTARGGAVVCAPGAPNGSRPGRRALGHAVRLSLRLPRLLDPWSWRQGKTELQMSQMMQMMQPMSGPPLALRGEPVPHVVAAE